MEQHDIEEKRNKLNLVIRELFVIIDLIDGEQKKYDDYIPNTLNESEYLDQQIKMLTDAKDRLLKVFKE